MTASNVQNGSRDIAGHFEAQVMELRRHPQKGWLSDCIVASDELFLVHDRFVSFLRFSHGRLDQYFARFLLIPDPQTGYPVDSRSPALGGRDCQNPEWNALPQAGLAKRYTLEYIRIV